MGVTGRRICRQWIVDEATGSSQRYWGTVLSVLSGKNGRDSAVYDVLHSDDVDSHEVGHLLKYHQAFSLAIFSEYVDEMTL